MPSQPAPETTILAVLVLALVLSGVLAYQAQRTAVSHRQTAEAALRDYAAFAGWELERRIADELPGTLHSAIFRARMPLEIANLPGRPAGRILPRADREVRNRLEFDHPLASGDVDPIAVFTAVLHRELERCGCEDAVSDIFLLDLSDGRLSSPSNDLPPSAHRVLAEIEFPQSIAEQAAVLVESTRYPARQGRQRMVQRMVGPLRAAPVVLPFDNSASRLVYTLLLDRNGEATAVSGFILDVPQLATPIIRSIVETTEFLPPSLTGGAPNDEVLALSVSIAGGDVLYRTAASIPEAIQVTDTLHTDLATLVLDVAIRPEMAQTLVIGGLPRSRLPLVLGLFGIALGLLSVAAVQLRRQRVLARLRSDFVSGVSHELRTPLAQIRLFADLLATDRLRPEQQERSVRIIGEEARRLAYLVQNILQFSNAERSATRIAPERTEAAPLLEDIVESFAPLARSRDVILVTNLTDNLYAPLDRGAIRQVLLNLLDNAVKYGPPGQRVEVRMTEDNGFLKISVRDEGPGVPPAERGRIWEPYHRLQRDAESASGGSGIGLAVVRELVELHGGRVSVGSHPDGGAEFVVYLPGAELATSTDSKGTQNEAP